jgi:hypothetical protein
MEMAPSETHDPNRAKIFTSQKRFNQAGKKYRPLKNPLNKPGKTIGIYKNVDSWRKWHRRPRKPMI